MVDKSKLQSLFDKHKNDKQGSYTDTSWKNFAAAMKNAKTVLENEKASQTDVDKAKTTLENAIKNLKKKAASTTDKNSPKTGDETPIAALAVLLTLSGAAVVVFEKKRRYRR